MNPSVPLKPFETFRMIVDRNNGLQLSQFAECELLIGRRGQLHLAGMGSRMSTKQVPVFFGFDSGEPIIVRQQRRECRHHTADLKPQPKPSHRCVPFDALATFTLAAPDPPVKRKTSYPRREIR